MKTRIVWAAIVSCLALLSCQPRSLEQKAPPAPEKRVLGVSPWSNPNYELMKQGGITWVRLEFSFPWRDRVGGDLTDKFKEQLETVKKVRATGLRIMGITTLAGVIAFDKSDNKTAWRSYIPAWAGTIESDSYYETYEKACEEIGKQTRGIVELWQVSNEMDIDVFRGPLSIEQAERFLLAGARGVKKGNPESKPGINPASLDSKYGEQLFRNLYQRPDCPFDYAGIDGYFGSWHTGGPEDWVPVIDRIHEITGKPVLINEWGYSSMQGSGKALGKKIGNGVCERQSWHNVWKKAHSPEEQAEYVNIALKIFATYPNVMGSFFYDWGDDPACYHCGQKGCPSECGWGMVDSEGKPKPAYHTFKDIAAQYY
jgi:hypothetical protein